MTKSSEISHLIKLAPPCAYDVYKFILMKFGINVAEVGLP